MDTVGFIALWNRVDQWHPAAAEAIKPLLAEGVGFYTTSFILLECGNASARAPYRHEPDVARERFEAAKTLIYPTADDWTEAWRMYRRGNAASAGIVDQVSFIVMRRMGIRQAFTNDRHFTAAGFETLF